ncbi:glucuronide transporter [Agrococcus jejuensis]|uniref:Glucuronide carrier protein n=1 Tax=Agrococcus jejuensis TaxID=399736 RepID=A0A1G8DVX2_9MICO|nr:glucuronide transporter [Agrococcus jejuensis]SDH61807.1 glucuronide carrier protein [Agrococcus jejuensis]
MSDATTRLTRLQIVGYGAGDAANNLAFTTATMFLLVYYTDVAGIGAAAAGTLLLVVRIFDAFADVFAGRVVDRTFTKRFGKFRPFLLFGSLPLLILSFLTFNVPQIGETGMLIYAYLTYAALGLAYSLVNIPYGSLAAAMTQTASERARLSGARTIGAVVVGGGLGIFVAPLITPERDLQTIFTAMTLGFVVVGFALYLFTFFTARERVQRDVPKVSMRQSMRVLRTNRPLIMLCGAAFLFLTGMLAMSTVQLYYLRDVLGAIELYAFVAIVQIAGTFGIGALLPRIVRAIGKRAGFLIGMAVVAVGGVTAALAPASIPGLGFTGIAIATLGVSFSGMLLWVLEADTVEYGEWQTGVRAEGITYALFSFTRKTGQAVGGALAAYALAIGGYAAGAGEQSSSAEWGIRIAVGGIPAVMAVLAASLMAIYPLTDARHREIVAEIAERRADTIDPVLSTAAFATRSGTTTPPTKETRA